MPLTVKNEADFKGMLLQVRNKPGQKYIFLLFRTADGLRMCLSKNADLVRSMKIGQKYRVKGQEYTNDQRTYLNMVSAVPVWSKVRLLRRRAGLLATVASVVVIAGVVGTGVLLRQNAERSNQTDAPSVDIQDQQDEKTPNKTSKISSIIGQQSAGTAPKDSPDAVTPTPTPNSSAVKQVATPTPAPATPTPTPAPANPATTPTPQPSVPANVAAAAASSTQIDISWTASDNAASYHVYRGGVEVGIVTGTSFQDSELNPETSYTYTVQAFNTAGDQSAQSSSATATTSAPAAIVQDTSEPKEL